MKLHVSRLGNGFPLIILHGLYGSGDNWLTLARQLSGFCEVYLVDQRNHGRSPHSDRHDYEALSEDLKELMDEYGLARAILLGHSMGGKTAMWFAASYPSRVSKLIIADISPRGYSGGESNERHSGFHRTVLQSLLSTDFSSVSTLGDIDRQLEIHLPDKQLRGFLLKNIEKTVDGVYRWRLNVKGLLTNLENLSKGLEQFTASGKSYHQFPVLFLRGEFSSYITEPDIQMIDQLFPDARLVTIRNAGHWLHAEQPTAFLSAVKKEILG